jgi:hypothetical protein
MRKLLKADCRKEIAKIQNGSNTVESQVFVITLTNSSGPFPDQLKEILYHGADSSIPNAVT